ncbi:MAG: hypothetical protein IPM46_11275 [Flavobacteriales bacterium]|nr:hypothetical protein [Flavobacteriales bacterium]
MMACVLVAGGTIGQVSIGGEPFEWGDSGLTRQGLPEVGFSVPDPSETEEQRTTGFRYGVQLFQEADVLALGRWDALSDRSMICRLVLRSPGALMLSVQFDQWELNEGDVVFLYTADRNRFIGGFDASNRQEDGSMATAVLPGDAVVIEYRTTRVHQRPARLRVSSITHGIMDLFGFNAEAGRDYNPGYQSAPCHTNVICPEAAAWQLEKRSVAMFLRPDGDGCTGKLLNNTQATRKPYFHFANHCFIPNTLNQYVFYFNYESPTCVGTVGPTNQTITGATLRANYYYTDFVLAELSSTPPASYNVYYAGWDRSGAVPQETVLIQHPMYDVKKIAFNYDPCTSFTDAIGVPAWRQNWEVGLMQAVSSGAPLFDQNHRVVGHAYDGAQVCSTATSIPTDCAKFSAAWDGAAASVRMRDWLNPANNLTVLDGFNPNASPTVSLRVRAYLEGPYNSNTTQMNAYLRAAGFIPLAEPYAALSYTHVGGGGGETTTNGVLSTTGNNAAVDWVLVELRSSANSANVVATRSALLQADGDIVAANDGSSALTFGAPSGSYYIAVRHRNHLGVMTAGTVALTNTAVTIDLSNGTTPIYGGANAMKTIGSRNILFAGDVDRNSTLRYTGQDNDRDPILSQVGGSVPTATVSGYFAEDVNMDGNVIYTGDGNDRDPILVNVGGSVPTNTRGAQLP